MLLHAYPTEQHAAAAQAIVTFFAACDEVDSVLLVNSCARGRATRDSCLDMTILVKPTIKDAAIAALQHEWDAHYQGDLVFSQLRTVGAYSNVDLDITTGNFKPHERDWTSGPDEFELEVGNTLVYCVPLWERHNRLEELRRQWLPYYNEALRAERLSAAQRYCRNNLDHIRLYVPRGLHFQSFHRLYDAFREFLQALFIARRTYPIAYNKWIKEQIVEILHLPELYPQLTALFEIQRFESDEIARKALALRSLLERYTQET